ncbi:protein UPSTREAM OF FLC-like [Canna indica]|uniref:Protein UPSTREAM OF FLC-like n=1 Tax=Canna indica TaxID=4628 RepID=A0AAQ3JWT7_9LILI|nr:protein UPSTREAM OF FLC-like [Canna indica]
MEVAGGRGRGVTSREDSLDRARLNYSHHHDNHRRHQEQQRPLRPLRKVQVIYYLSRNGQLEHPHFIELPFLPNQHLRLRDVMERLTLLRGKGMPSLFAWSCKRSYKNGYVWNDLTENDIIYPADGVEYVLKGSEIIPGAYERFLHIPASSRRRKALPMARKLHLDLEDEELVEEEEVVEDEEPRRGKPTVGSEANAISGVAMDDEMERVETRVTTRQHHAPTELLLDDSSPPSSTSSDKPAAHALGGGGGRGSGSASQRFEDADQAPEPGLTRNSVLLQLIACGSAALKGRSSSSGGVITKTAGSPSMADAEDGKRGSSRRHLGLVSRLASRAVVEEEEKELRCVTVETPRFCHPLVEDKEYFSGSIVERGRSQTEPSLKKSSSYNEERSSKLGIEEGRAEVEEDRGGGVKGKCIPGRRKPSVKQQ